MAVAFDTLAQDIVAGVGGTQNIKSARHCATRLRLDLRDDALANTEAIKAMPGVVTVVQAGGQYQVVIGNDVPHVHAAMVTILEGGGAVEEDSDGPKGNLLDQFIELVSAIFHPVLWPLAGAGLFKAFLSLFATLKWVDTTSSGYAVLNAASDSLIYFLPIVLAIPAAKRFKANQFTAVAVAGALVHPSVIGLGAVEGDVTFFGIPLVIMSYVSSVIPIIIGVWLLGYLERFLIRTLPSAIRNFTTPLVSMLVMVPLILLTVGPVTTFAANAVAGGVDSLFVVAPWAAGAIMGGLWQVFVLFGLHWGFVPIMIQQLGGGFSILTGPLLGAVLAQAAATLAVLLRTKHTETKVLAGPSALSGFLAGITEPAIYGVNLPRKLPFYFGIAGGAIGGIFAGIAGAGTTAFVFPSLIGIPAFLSTPNLPLFFIGVAISVSIGFFGTFFWGVNDKAVLAAEKAPSVAPGATESASDVVVAGTGVEVLVRAPMTGRLVALADVPDPVFSSGKMGLGVGIIPTSGTVYAPVSGKVVVAMASGHAYGIRSDDGIEVLVHVGLDTVNMKGEGFRALVTKGDRVEAGQVLAEVDLDAIVAAGYPTTTVLIVTNTARQKSVEPTTGDSVDANDVALLVTR